jgi:quinoprotein glucose dehydrogenase
VWACLLLFGGFSSVAVAEQWAHYRGDPKGSGYSDADQITPENVGQLSVAWQFSSGELKRFPNKIKNTALEVTPILLPKRAGEHLVLCTPFNRVVALDPKTGKERWSFDPKINQGGSRPFKCRGVSWWEDTQKPASETCAHQVLLATHDRRLFSIDAASGLPCENFGDSGQVKLYSEEEGFVPGDIASSSPPAIVGDVVIVGSAVVDFLRAKTPAGRVQAYDLRTGKERWVFNIIPKDPSDPAYATWPENSSEVTGSANAWAPLSVDLERDMVFVPTGSPSPDYYGVLRPGNNRYANSVLAIRASTGELVWDFQFVHHDLWDFDTPAQPLLTELNRDGEKVPVLIQVTKQGFVFVLNRLTGEPFFAVEERAVSQSSVSGEWLSPTQPVPVTPAPLMKSHLVSEDAWGLTPFDRSACKKRIESLFSEGLFTPLQERNTLMMPGSLGGANWGGAVLWKERQLLYVNVNTMPFFGRLIETTEMKTGGHLPPAGKGMSLTMSGTPYTVEVNSLLSPLGIPCIAPPWGKLMAIDLSDGKVQWESALGSVHEMGPVNLPFEVNWGTPNLGGGLITKSGLLFIAATMDRRFRAFDAQSGEVLWSHKLPVDATASPMTYTIDGRQYVVVASGGHHMFSRPMGDTTTAFALD